MESTSSNRNCNRSIGRFALWTVGEIVDGGVSGMTEGRMGDNLDILIECGVVDISEVPLRVSQRCPHLWDEVEEMSNVGSAKPEFREVNKERKTKILAHKSVYSSYGKMSADIS